MHDCNPESGGPYSVNDRKMREDEFEDFLKSVKGWERQPSGALSKTFTFPDPMMLYQFMGRLTAFSFYCEKYPKVQVHKNKLTATVYSATFKGITSHEAKLAAFMNDHFNLMTKAQQQRERMLQHLATTEVMQVLQRNLPAEEAYMQEEIRGSMAARAEDPSALSSNSEGTAPHQQESPSSSSSPGSEASAGGSSTTTPPPPPLERDVFHMRRGASIWDRKPLYIGKDLVTGEMLPRYEKVVVEK